MFFRWTVVAICFLYWTAWKCESRHRRAPNSTNSYKKSIDKITMDDKKAKSFLYKRDNTDTLREECCGESVCHFEEQEETTTSWDGIYQILCEISIREQRNCKSGFQSGTYFECAADIVGRKNCENPCPSKDDFYCSHLRECVPNKLRCDSNKDCSNWHDERNCTITSIHTKSSVILNTELREQSKKSKYYGDVFIFNKSVCDTGWNEQSASVMCKTLGFSENTKAIPSFSNFFISKTTNYIMANVNCTGAESFIGNCYHETFHWCNDFNVAGVACLDMNSLQLVSNGSSNEGDVFLIGLPFLSSLNKDDTPDWGEIEAQVVCNYLFGDEFDRGTNGVPVYSYNISKVTGSAFCLGLSCPDEKTNSITQCQIIFKRFCIGYNRNVKCAKCSPNKLIEILDRLTIEGNYTEIINSANDALLELDQSCYFWTDCYLPDPRYPEYCLVRGLLDDILSIPKSKEKKIVVIETSINPLKLLKNNIWNQKFSQIQDQINNLGDALTSKIGKYFSDLADFDEQIAGASDTYGQGDWMEARSMLESKQKEFADELKDIFIFAFSVTSADMAQKVAALALATAQMGNPIGMLVDGAGNILDFQDRLSEVAKSATVIAKLSFLIDRFLPKLNELSIAMYERFKENEKAYEEIIEFLTLLRDKSFTLGHAKDFLKAYNDFTPALSDDMIDEYGGLLEEMITECCNVIENPETALGAIPAIISVAMGSCPMARKSVRSINVLLGTINSKQTEIMDSFAQVARARLSASNARHLRNSLRKNSIQKVEAKVLALKAFSLLKYHKLTLIEKACNYLTYMNFGAEPQECARLLRNPHGDIEPLISMETCHMSECPNASPISGVFRIPATFGVFEKGALDLSSLYSIKDNKTNGSALLVIPDREWLVENKWIHSYQKGPFFLQSLKIHLPPMSSHTHTYTIKTVSFASELNGKSYAIDKGTVIENSYDENLSRNCKLPNPYNREACNAKFRKYCISTNGKINGKLLPRLENSIWKVSLRSDHALKVPYPAEKFYLYAEATFWYKGVADKKKAARRNKVNSDYLKCCLNENKYYNPFDDRCESCPEGSEPRLYDYYCEKCPAGYETTEDLYGCQPCKHNYYKEKAGPGNCQKCPEGEVALGEGSQFCIQE